MMNMKKILTFVFLYPVALILAMLDGIWDLLGNLFGKKRIRDLEDRVAELE